jgi:hypothetical protein
MPIKTPYYKLEAFGWGDVYSARIDARRFATIDNQLAFISDLIGPGIISGWEFAVDSEDDLIVTPGFGMIGRRVIRTFGASQIIINSNSENYIYMKEKADEVGEISGNSEIASVIGVNTIPPASPVGLAQESSVVA